MRTMFKHVGITSIVAALSVVLVMGAPAPADNLTFDGQGVVVPLSPALEAILDANLAPGVLRHKGSANPANAAMGNHLPAGGEGFVGSGPCVTDTGDPCGTPGTTVISDSRPVGQTGPNGNFWRVHHDPTAGGGGGPYAPAPRALQRYQGTSTAPSGVITMTAIGNIEKNVSSAVAGGTPADPLFHGNTLIVSFDLAVGGPTITGAWGNELDRVFAGNSSPGDPAPQHLLDATKTHVYQWTGDPSTGFMDLYVDGQIAIEDVDVNARRTGLDGHVGWLWGSVTRSNVNRSTTEFVDIGTEAQRAAQDNSICWDWPILSQTGGCTASSDNSAMGTPIPAPLFLPNGDPDLRDIESLSNWYAIQIQTGTHILPEPASLILMTAAAPLLLRRRRR